MSGDLAAWAETALGHRFRQIDLVERALTHSSKSRRKVDSYERLEFLGDRVLGCIMADWLFSDFDENERDMARRFAKLVDKESCAIAARAAGASDYIRLDHAARAANVHKSDNVLGDVCEALIGALYLDGGLPAADAFVRRAWSERVASGGEPPRDPKNRLQEWAQKGGRPLPNYEIVWRDGPDHAPKFRVEVTVRGLDPATGEGTSRQEAEKAAALSLLEREGAK